MRKFALLLLLTALLPSTGVFSEDESKAHASRGDELRGQGRFEEAVAEYKEALRLSGVLEAAAVSAPRDGSSEDWAVRRHREALRLENPDAR